jgi:tetratricopeptide (TPR) repeat protein
MKVLRKIQPTSRTLTAILLCSQLLFVFGCLDQNVCARSTKHKHSTSTAQSKSISKSTSKSKSRKKIAHKATVHQKIAKSNEPKLPDGYKEKSKLLLEAYKFHKVAWNNMTQKDYSAAVANLHKAIVLTTKCYGEDSRFLLPLYLDLASAAEQDNKLNQAVAALNTCLKLDPRDVDASVKLALTKLQQGNTKEAMTTAKQAADRCPQDPRTHVLMSLLLSKTGQANQATDERSAARKLYQNLPQIKTLANQTSGTTQGTTSSEQTSTPSPSESDEENNPELELP